MHHCPLGVPAAQAGAHTTVLPPEPHFVTVKYWVTSGVGGYGGLPRLPQHCPTLTQASLCGWVLALGRTADPQAGFVPCAIRTANGERRTVAHFA